MSRSRLVTDCLPSEATCFLPPKGMVTIQAWHSMPRLWHSSMAKAKRIVSGIASGFSCQYGVEGFDVRTIKHITTGTSLEKYRIEVGLFQAVEDIDQFFFLSPDTCRSGCFGAWPVQSVDRSYPGSPYLVFRGGLRMERK